MSSSPFSTPFKLHKQNILQTLSMTDDDFEPISTILNNKKLNLNEEDKKRLKDLNDKAMKIQILNKLKRMKIKSNIN